MIQILLFLWQLPQNLVGLALIMYYAIAGRIDYTCVFYGAGRKWLRLNCTYCVGFPGGISLGCFSLMNTDAQFGKMMQYHEYGHSVQSVMLGPLYLLVIGIPSLLHAWWWNSKRGISYYDFWTERWADRLGGVKR